MKTILFITVFFPALVLGQEFRQVITKTDTFYVLNSLDSTNRPKTLPNGRYKVFYDNNTTKLKYIFNVRNNNVDGFFKRINVDGSFNKIGTYKDDSLWTFLNEKIIQDKANSFEVGLWQTSFDDGVMIECFHPMPYKGNDTIYVDRWFYNNNELLSENTYYKVRGWVKQILYEENGEKRQIKVDGEKNNSELIIKKDGTILKQTLEQQFNFVLNLDETDSRLYQFRDKCPDCIEQITYDKMGRLISGVSIDYLGRVRGFESEKISIFYDVKGIPTRIFYKKGKREKKKRLR